MSHAVIRNILFPTDFSALSGNALETAIAICLRQDASLHLMHCPESKLLLSPPEARMASGYMIPEMEKAGMENLSALAGKIKEKYPVHITTHLEAGNPADAIRDKAKKLDCDLVVMGTHGTSGFREFFIGSTACHVIRNTTIPVLTIPGKKKVKEFKKILFPIRATRGVMEKYDFIGPVIQKNDAELFIAALSLPGEAYNLGPMDAEIRELGKSLRIHRTRFKSEHYVCKNYAKKVLELAKKEKADLVVINATLDHTWQQVFMGPYTRQIVNHARIPVLSIRTPDPGLKFAGNKKDEMRKVKQDDPA